MQARLWALAIATPMIINAVLAVVVPTTVVLAIALDQRPTRAFRMMP
jgi:hypothetical protein